MSSNLEVIFSTSYDDRHPPNNILNTNNSMFWASTGLYPQEIVLSLKEAKALSEFNIKGFNIKKLSIESCENDSAVKFTTQYESSNIPNSNSSLQNIKCTFNNTNTLNKIIKIIILEGYGNFCSISSTNVK